MFLNPALLGGLFAVSAPIIIHLISKQRHKRVRWGAMQFLIASLQRSSRRIQLQQLILLFLRCVAVALVAVALSRPFFLGKVHGRPQIRTDMVLLIDNSLSMGYGAERVAVSVRARRLADRLIDLLRTGDTLWMVAVEKEAHPLSDTPVFDFAKARKRLKALELSEEPARFYESILSAIETLEFTRNPRREIFILTDMQSYDWSLEEEILWEGVVEKLDTLTVRPDIFLIDCSGGSRGNRAITMFAPPELLPTPGRAVSFKIRLSNFSSQPANSVKVSFFVNKSFVEDRTIKLSPFESSELVFKHKFEDAGRFVLSAKTEEDSLPADNKRWLGVNVEKSVPVLIIENEEKRYIHLALSPDEKSGISPIRLTSVRPGEINASSLEGYFAIVLTDVSMLPFAALAGLEKYVERGGGIIVVPGDECDLAFWNESIYADGEGLLPVPLRKKVNLAVPVSLRPQATPHPALMFLRGTKADFLSTSQIKKFIRPGSYSDPRLQVLASYSTGQPFLLEKKKGKGAVIMFTTDLQRDWNDLPTHSFFVALLHQLVYYMASLHRNLPNVEVGTKVVFPLPEGVERATVTFAPRGEEPSTVEIQKKGNRFITEPLPCERSGVYELKIASAQKTIQIPITANPDPHESDLSPLTSEQIKVLQDKLGLKVARGWEELIRLWGETTIRREYWRSLILLAIAVLLLETFLTRRWTRIES